MNRTHGRIVSRVLKKSFEWFDRLTTNGLKPMNSTAPPFALSLSKGKSWFSQQPVGPLLIFAGTTALILVLSASRTPFVHAATSVQCDIQRGPCSSTINGVSLIFDVQPKPVASMSENTFIVTLMRSGTPVTDARVQIDLSMPDMFMGKNQPALKHVKDGRYEGKGVIMQCVSGKKTWQADVVVLIKKEIATTRFVFEVK